MASKSLSELLSEPLHSVIQRERLSLEKLLLERRNRVVLFGAGNLGQEAARALQGIGIKAICLSDNNKDRWGSRIHDLDVLPPKEAAALYGKDSTFLISIWNPFHWFNETAEQLTNYGCDVVAPYVLLHWRFPESFLPCMLNDLPHKVYEDRESVLVVEHFWEDIESHRIYEANIRFRAVGDLKGLPGRPTENTYFPLDIMRLDSHDRFLDCGATCGEMAQDLLQKRGQEFESFSAIEADSISFPRLQAFREALPGHLREKIKLYDCAVGANRGTVCFSNTGGTGSRITSTGMLVECHTIDELFLEEPLTFIKMDIEGGEYDALLGGRAVLQRDQPILAICVYHTQNDIWRIPLMVHELLPEHRLYLRAYEGDGFQTVMYAVPTNRVYKTKFSPSSTSTQRGPRS